MKNLVGTALLAAVASGASFSGRSAARADAGGTIVFSARFYNPPSQAKKTTSYWHLYRVAPDGSGRKPVTTGSYDDTSPAWSPDGRRIAFLRRNAAHVRNRDEGNAELASLCLLDAQTGQIRVLRQGIPAYDASNVSAVRWSPGGDWLAVRADQKPEGRVLLRIPVGGAGKEKFARTPLEGWDIHWSPDGKSAIVASNDGGSDPASLFASLVSLETGRTTALPAGIACCSWRDADSIVGATASVSAPALVFLSKDGREIRRTSVRLKSEDMPFNAFPMEVAAYPPDSAGFMLLGLLSGESTMGHFNEYFRVDTATGAATDFTSGKFLSWSPDGKRFCAVVHRDQASYGKRADGREATVWTQPLVVGDGATGRTREIVSGLVYVAGADWRPTPHHETAVRLLPLRTILVDNRN